MGTIIYKCDAIFECIANFNLDNNLRSYYCNLLLNLYVNAHPQQFINLVHYSRFWNDLSGKRYEDGPVDKEVSKKVPRIFCEFS